ncbi:hypothetical protein D3C81_1515290 [compost metagenome]
MEHDAFADTLNPKLFFSPRAAGFNFFDPLGELSHYFILVAQTEVDGDLELWNFTDVMQSVTIHLLGEDVVVDVAAATFGGNVVCRGSERNKVLRATAQSNAALNATTTPFAKNSDWCVLIHAVIIDVNFIEDVLWNALEEHREPVVIVHHGCYTRTRQCNRTNANTQQTNTSVRAVKLDSAFEVYDWALMLLQAVIVARRIDALEHVVDRFCGAMEIQLFYLFI